ncbi:UNVERIFIED_CONTAM: hypothetical protein FKN15_004729 [Acipenser sinensis]
MMDKGIGFGGEFTMLEEHSVGETNVVSLRTSLRLQVSFVMGVLEDEGPAGGTSLYYSEGDQALILVNNKITTIHPKAFTPMGKLQRLYLSKNFLKEMPVNMPKNLQELRIHENEIAKIKKSSFEGMTQVIVMELGTNPLKSVGIENGAFQDLKKLSYIRISDTNITAIPKDKAFAVIVNTRHPSIRAEIEKGMNNAITSVWGESYSLQFDFQRVIKQFFSTVNYDTDGEGLTISFEFKVDALFDISYLFGFSKRKAEVNGKVLNLFSANEEKRKKVKMFLDKISEPYIRRSSVPDRRMSLFSMGMLLFAL